MSGQIRYRVDPRDVPIEKAARRLHLTKAELERYLPKLYARGFPEPDETTGMFDLDAIDEWRRRRHPELFLTATEVARSSKELIQKRLREFERSGPKKKR